METLYVVVPLGYTPKNQGRSLGEINISRLGAASRIFHKLKKEGKKVLIVVSPGIKRKRNGSRKWPEQNLSLASMMSSHLKSQHGIIKDVRIGKENWGTWAEMLASVEAVKEEACYYNIVFIFLSDWWHVFRAKNFIAPAFLKHYECQFVSTYNLAWDIILEPLKWAREIIRAMFPKRSTQLYQFILGRP